MHQTVEAYLPTILGLLTVGIVPRTPATLQEYIYIICFSLSLASFDQAVAGG